MSFKPVSLVYVYYYGSGHKELVGRLLHKDRQIFFEYDLEFIRSGLQLSPFHLPLKSGVISAQNRIFEGLFGVFNDSLPDGWGRLLLDRKMLSLGINPGALSPLDRLCFVGSNGMGALSYEPENPSSAGTLIEDLDEIEKEVHATYQDNDSYVDNLIALGGSSAGARPKVLLRIDGEGWLIKFRSSLDPSDIGAIEYAYHLMAKEAGLSVPKAKLFPSKTGSGFFGVKRFDREGDDRIKFSSRIFHMHTVAGLLHADHRELSLDYESIMNATLHLTRDLRECEIQFRNSVFNVLSHNRDDHSKNFSFLMNEHGVWKVSPAYDLTFSSGPAGEHSTTIMGEGKNPTLKHLLRLASVANIAKDKAKDIIEQVSAAIQKWEHFAITANVSKSQIMYIKNALSNISKNN